MAYFKKLLISIDNRHLSHSSLKKILIRITIQLITKTKDYGTTTSCNPRRAKGNME